MKAKFPILVKVILLGIGVSILTVGISSVLSYLEQRKKSEEDYVSNINNVLSQLDYICNTSEDSDAYLSELDDIRTYVASVYDNDPDKKELSDFTTFEEYEKYYKDLYTYIFQYGGMIGLSQEMAEFKSKYSDWLSLITNCQIASNCKSVFIAYFDTSTRLVMMADSRMNSLSNAANTTDSFYHLPGSHYDFQSGDIVIKGSDTMHGGYVLDGYKVLYTPMFKTETDGSKRLIANIYIEYTFDEIHAASDQILKNNLLVLGLSSIALIGLYALLSYLMFVRNINRLSRASTKVINKIENKNFDEAVEVHVRAEDEMKILAESFNELQKEVIRYVDIVKQEVADKEKINAELSVASRIQLEALPAYKFDDKNFSVRAYIKSAKEVGGDFYDYFYLDENRLAVIISDVSGKGIPASLFMMMGKELIKSALLSYKSLPEAIKYANNMIVRTNRELLFITSFIGVIDLKKHEIKYVNAGHEKPYIVTPTGVIKLEGESNIVIGLEPDYVYKEEKHEINEDDYIFMFTDGLNESINDKREEFSYQRIEECLNAHEGTIDGLIASMNDKLSEFVGEEEQFDDVTMVAIKLIDKKLSLHFEKKDYKIITDIVDRFEEKFTYISPGVKASAGIIIDELVNNLISYEKREDLVIDVDFEVIDDELRIKITCNGDDYNPFANHKEKYYKEYSSDIQEGGFGLSIIKDLSKSYSYEYKNKHSVIVIVLTL